MAKIFASKHGYSVDANQELLAQVSRFQLHSKVSMVAVCKSVFRLQFQGGSNFVGSFFNCGPIAASLSRSLIQEQVRRQNYSYLVAACVHSCSIKIRSFLMPQTGGRTQLASLFSCSLLLIVLLWIAPFFESLPKVRYS